LSRDYTGGAVLSYSPKYQADLSRLPSVVLGNSFSLGYTADFQAWKWEEESTILNKHIFIEAEGLPPSKEIAMLVSRQTQRELPK
jgi:hypothetical protein